MALAYAGASLAIFGGGGGGSGIVFDPTNYVQNTLTAVYAVKQEVREATRVVQDLKNISNKLSNVGGILQVIPGLQDVQNLVAVSMKLKSELESLGQVAETFKNLYGASQATTPANFLALLKKREVAGDASVKALMDNAKELQVKIERTTQQHQQLADSLAGVEGITQAVMTTTTAVGILVQQNQALLSAYQNINMTQAATLAKDNAKELQADKAEDSYYKQVQQLYQASQRK